MADTLHRSGRLQMMRLTRVLRGLGWVLYLMLLARLIRAVVEWIR